MAVHLTFLGTGSALACGKRRNTSLMLEASDGTLIVIDCSSTPSRAISANDPEALTRVSTVLLSHAHVDHVYALPSLVHNMWLRSLPGGGSRLRLFGGAETLHVALALIDAFGLRSKDDAVEIDTVAIPPAGGVLDIACPGVRVEAFPVVHVGLVAFGFALDLADGGRTVFSADSEVCEAVESRIWAKTVLIHDCGSAFQSAKGHAAAHEVAQLVSRAQPASVYLTHIPDLTSDAERDLCRIVAGAGGIPVRIPADGEQLVIAG